jgi:predicted nucleic acid-binding protein
MTLVDTSVWIDFLAVRNTLLRLGRLNPLLIKGRIYAYDGVILTEVLQGIRDDKQYNQNESVLSSLIYLPMDRSTFLLAANIDRTLRSRGITIRNSVDCMIAAVSIEHKADLLHNDGDFDHIADVFGLQIVGGRAVQ